MFDYIKGKIAELTPTYVVVDCNGVGYHINISLNTYSALVIDGQAQLFIHQVIKEDAHSLFGFKDKAEREIFCMLISVSGIGANTARMMLSSLSPSEIAAAITSSNVRQLQSIKGIGEKTAQRAIVELKDKMGKVALKDEIFISKDNRIREEALSALVMLGFNKVMAEKALDKLLQQDSGSLVEDLIKKALKIL